MSLLMDALNKAEQAKRQGQATETDAAAAAKPATRTDAEIAAKPVEAPLTLELTPLMVADDSPADAKAPATLPKLPAHLGVLDEEFIAHAAAGKPGAKEKPPLRAPPPEPSSVPAPAPVALAAAASAGKPAPTPQKANDQARDAAQNLFDAKQPRPAGFNKRLALILGLLTVLAIGAIGVYVWLQLQPSGGLTPLKPGANIPRPASPPTQPVPPVPAVVAVAPPAAERPPPLPATEPARPAAAPARNEAPRTFAVTTSNLALNPSLTNAYDVYMSGNFAAARTEYLQVLKSEPNNLDALHGMAAISLRQGQHAAAEEYYLKAIEADPKDALALAGLIGLKSQIDPLQAETRLNALIAAQPDLPFLHFALGSLYARQNRWNEAQAAFFKAYNGEPDNPDTLFNLAVSLDQLHQSRLALQYYNLALAAAANRPASFDKGQVSARLRELQP